MSALTAEPELFVTVNVYVIGPTAPKANCTPLVTGMVDPTKLIVAVPPLNTAVKRGRIVPPLSHRSWIPSKVKLVINGRTWTGTSVPSCAASAFLARRERPGFYLLVAATGSVLAVTLITVFGNIPINNQIKRWSIAAPPASWVELSAQWWQFQTVRTIAAVCGMALLIVAVLMRRSAVA